MDFIENTVKEAVKSPFEEVEAGFILGNKAFKEKVQNLLINLQEDEDLPTLKNLKKLYPPEFIVDKIATILDINREGLIRRGRNKKDRKIAIYLTKVISNKQSKEFRSWELF